MWPKIGSDVSRKVTLALKTNQGQGDLIWKMRPYLKWLNNIQTQRLIHCWQNLVLLKTPSINIFISSDTKIFEIQNSLKYCKTSDSPEYIYIFQQQVFISFFLYFYLLNSV